MWWARREGRKESWRERGKRRGKGFFLFLGSRMKRKAAAKTRVQEKNKKDTSNQQ
jgi:hypothetical protein